MDRHKPFQRSTSCEIEIEQKMNECHSYYEVLLLLWNMKGDYQYSGYLSYVLKQQRSQFQKILPKNTFITCAFKLLFIN